MVRSRHDNSGQTLSHREEQKLIKAISRGDKMAAKRLIDNHKQRLFAFVWRVVPHHQEAEDVCQEAFLRAFSSLDSFDPSYRFSTWIFTIAYRLALNSRRKQRNNPCNMNWGELQCPASSVEDRLVESEEAKRLKETVWRAVDRLNTPQKSAVILFYREQLSCQEISEVLQIPVATVKSHLHRARQKLREILEQMSGCDVQWLDGSIQLFAS